MKSTVCNTNYTCVNFPARPLNDSIIIFSCYYIMQMCNDITSEFYPFWMLEPNEFGIPDLVAVPLLCLLKESHSESGLAVSWVSDWLLPKYSNILRSLIQTWLCYKDRLTKIQSSLTLVYLGFLTQWISYFATWNLGHAHPEGIVSIC